MKWIFAIATLLFYNHMLAQGNDSLTARIVLIGDAGELINGRQPVIDGIRKFIPIDKKTTVIYLGDNLYRVGLPDEQHGFYDKSRAVLDTQVALVNKTQARGYFIPGNHDWENGGGGGYAAVLRQQQYIDRIARENVKFYPEGGCPGPVEVKINDDITLIIMDSQWWLHPSEKPGIESDCPQKTKEEVLVEIQDILSKNDDKLIIFACHHPFKSNGIHGGYYKLKQHIFPLTDIRKNLYVPLPILGSIYPVARGVFGTPQDLKHPVYQDMVNRVQDVVKEHRHTVFVAGHEHNMQYFSDSNFNYVLSGAGCKHSRVQPGRTAEFVSTTLGFATLEVSKNKNVQLSFYTVAPDSFGLAFRKNIMNFSKVPEIEDTIARTVPIYSYRDSVLAPASLQYRRAGSFKRTLLGDNYRLEWSTPVMFKEFNLKKEKGGFLIDGRGGGKQTKSLTLIDKFGVEWALRTMDKDAERVLPENLRGTPAQDVVQDLISASYPYAPLVVPTLAKAAGVTQATPEIFFVPDDPAFGMYRRLFANKICFLEKKDPVPNGLKTKSTQKVINNLLEENDHRVDQKATLKARMLDIFISDFDRHMDQWKWAELDSGALNVYKPIAKDRDQAFFYSDGLVMEWATRKRLPVLRGFRHNIEKINGLGFSARDFDRFFLNGLSKRDWEQTVNEFTGQMTDSVIDAAVRKLPKEIYPITADTIATKLKDRRGKMEKAAMRYYKFLAKNVNVLGSNKQEFFNIIGTDSGTIVNMYAREKYGDTAQLMYSRVFDPKLTKELRLYGLNGNDRFHVEGKRGIRIRMIGGKGIDTFDVHGSMKSFAYDLSTEPNYLEKGRRTKKRFAETPAVNAYSIYEFQYDIKRFPRVNLGYNSEDGLMLGVGFWIRTHGFRKQPYESDNKLTTLYSIFDNAYNVRYRGEFNHLFRSYDLVISSDLYNPTLNNFFGLGNETKKTPGLGNAFYRVRYKYLANDFQVRQRMFSNKLGIAIGPSFFHYWNREKDNRGKILDNPELVKLDSNSIYGVKSYVGGRLDIDVNNLNSEFYPTRGVNWNTQLRYFTGLNNNSSPLLRFQSDMTIYASLAEAARLLAIIKLGGGHIFSENYEYFQALNLGANNYLRGFRKNRFAGSSMAYASMEFRYKLFSVRSAILPGSFGLVGFDDVGRVWIKNEDSKKWHNVIGGGVYYLPFDLVSIAATVARSEEELLFNFSVGTKLSFYF
jgi:hypothetical protein